MKKIIVAIDGLKYAESATAYATHLAKLSNAHLVGIFLDDFTYHSYQFYDLVGDEGLSTIKRQILDHQDQETRKEAVEKFEYACQDAALGYSVHHDNDIAIQELLHESIYADLLVMHSGERFTHSDEVPPSGFIRDLLSSVQCPVLIVPDQFKPTEQLVLLYDGQPSSVFAIRMFNYIFPTLQNLPTEVFSVNTEKQGSHVPDGRLMKEFMKRHYPNALYNVVRGIPEEEIVKELKEKDSAFLVVLGAYQRGMVSRWFRPSMADLLMKEIDAPLFIAHSG